jgi:hypothetical protein
VTPDQFITKWKATELKERSTAQSQFIDLCRMLDERAYGWPADISTEEALSRLLQFNQTRNASARDLADVAEQ